MTQAPGSDTELRQLSTNAMNQLFICRRRMREGKFAAAVKAIARARDLSEDLQRELEELDGA